MEDSELARVEKLCLDLYASPQITHLERMEAHRALMILQTSSQYLVQCQYILEHSRSDYALLFAAKSVMVIVSKDWRNISSAKRASLHKFLFEKVIAIQDPNHFISKALINVLCRVTRLGWITEASFRTVIDDLVHLFQTNNQHVLLALRTLSELVTEFNQAQTGISSSGAVGGRMVAQAFRERFALTRCFHISLDLVHAASHEQKGSIGRVMLKDALHTLQVCLEFDFVGTSQDDSDDGTSCLYIPADWAGHIATAAAVKQLFDIYDSEWSSVQSEAEIDASEDSPASICLQLIALLTASRRSVFDQESRRAFLAELLSGTTNLMNRRLGLSHSESCLHHLCRCLAQIKTHFQLQELAGSPQYPSWLQTVTQFTIDAYSAWATVSSRSVFFLSSLWSSMVLPIPYLRFRNVYNADKRANSVAPPEPSVEMGLNDAVPKVLAAYVQSRCDMCAFAALESLEDGGGAPPGAGTSGGFGAGIGGIEDDPLDDEALLLEELASFPVLTRFNFPQAAAMLESIYMDAHRKRSAAFQALIQPHQHQQVDMQALRRALTESQARLAFLTYLIGVVVGGNVSRVASNCIENLDGINAELASLVFGMVVSTQQAEDTMTSQGKQPTEIIFGMGTDSGLKLELASLYFFRCFQNLYIESRAREDVVSAENKRKQQTLSVVEDPSGFLSLSWNRLASGGISATVGGGNAPTAPSSGNGSTPEGDNSMDSAKSDGGSSSTAMTAHTHSSAGIIAGRDGRTGSRARHHGLPGVLPKLESLGLMSSVMAGAGRGTCSAGGGSSSTSNGRGAGGGNDIQDGVDEGMTDEFAQRASSMQQGIAGRLGIQGGDRVLLDIAMRRIFGLLQHAHNVGDKGDSANGSGKGTTFAATANLVERALGVLYQLSVGVTIVHTGARYSPRLMYSGRLLLESDVVQELLKNPSAERFPLLLDPRHGRARTFLMATLSKLLFTQARFPKPISEDEGASTSPVASGPPGSGYLEVGVSSAATRISGDLQSLNAFTAFMAHLTTTADGLLSLATGGLTPAAILANVNQVPPIDAARLRDPKVAVSLIGLVRDLRGICFSAATPKDYEMILSWLCPTRMPVLVAAASAWYDNTDVAGPLLKLVAELIHLRRNRIVIPQNSAGGLILSREVCRVVLAYVQPNIQNRTQKDMAAGEGGTEVAGGGSSAGGGGNGSIGGDSDGGGAENAMSMDALRDAIMAMSSGSDGSKARKVGVISLAEGTVGAGITVDFSPKKMKCVCSCILILTRIMHARLVNVGIMELYGDTSLTDATRGVLELAFTGSPLHVMSFTKVSRALILMLNKLSEQHVLPMVAVNSGIFARMVACLGEALNSTDTGLSTPAARVIEAIAVFRCEAVAHATSPTSKVLLESSNIIFTGSKIGPSAAEMQHAVQAFASHEATQPQLFGELLGLALDRLFTMTPGQGAPNLWSLARPVLPFILCSPQDFEDYKTAFVHSQSAKRQPAIAMELDKLLFKLSPAVSKGPDGRLRADPTYFNEVLRMNDVFTKDLCTFARKLKSEF